ncbi:MAG: nuclear transport factor 2 family protein [Aeromicrobium sp.]
MSRWSRAELEAAFAHYGAEVRAASETKDWGRFADLFTEDATYDEHLYGEFHGREEIRAWIVKTMTTMPGCWMPDYPPSWYVIDEERGRIVCEILNRMQDPGDGSIHEAANITILTYAGDNLFSKEEDVYNPSKFTDVITDWARVADVHGKLTDEGVAWMDGALPEWRQPA